MVEELDVGAEGWSESNCCGGGGGGEMERERDIGKRR